MGNHFGTGAGEADKIAGLSLSSRLLCADGHLNDHPAVAPGLHTSTTFRYDDDPEKLVSVSEGKGHEHPGTHVYSRHTSPNMDRLEALLSTLLGSQAVAYSSGLSAFHALLVHLNPRRIAIGPGYHGCHGVVSLMQRLTGLEVLPLDCAPGALGPGDVLHVETPWNPTGEARDLAAHAARARAAGAWLTVDATFAPPPLQDPFAQGADVVLHSATKYIGGHSDMLCGVLAAHPRHGDGIARALRGDRVLLGSVPGSLEGWLGVRSLRTLELRVRRQSETATRLAAWLAGAVAGDARKDKHGENHGGGDNAKDGGDKDGNMDGAVVGRLVERVMHASLQPEAREEGSWLRRQMPGGFGPVFAVCMRDEASARRLPSRLALFQHATSLGGVESLIEWRAMSDASVDRRLLRVSVGVEDFEDLKADLLAGLRALEE